MSVLIALLSLAAEALVGYPDGLYRAVGHPVTWIGRLIACLDRLLNRASESDSRRRAAGIAALLVIVAVPAVLAYNWLQSRNKKIAELLQGFSTDVLANITSKGAVKPAVGPAPAAKPAAPVAAPVKK